MGSIWNIINNTELRKSRACLPGSVVVQRSGPFLLMCQTGRLLQGKMKEEERHTARNSLTQSGSQLDKGSSQDKATVSKLGISPACCAAVK